MILSIAQPRRRRRCRFSRAGPASDPRLRPLGRLFGKLEKRNCRARPEPDFSFQAIPQTPISVSNK